MKSNRRKFVGTLSAMSAGLLAWNILPIKLFKKSMNSPNAKKVTEISVHPLAVKRNNRG
jgi:hypothetical protein